MTESGGEGRTLLPFHRAKSRPLAGKGQSQGLPFLAAGIGAKTHKTGRVGRHVTEEAASLNLGFVCGGKSSRDPELKPGFGMAKLADCRGAPASCGRGQALSEWSGPQSPRL